MNGPVTKWGKADPYRWELTNQIAAVLHANGTNVRPFNTSMKTVADFPEGGIRQLIDEIPFNGVRAEVAGTTVSIEITTERGGDLSTGDQMRFACYDFDWFCAWFYNLLRRSGQTPAPVIPINLLDGHYRLLDARPSLPSTLTLLHTTKKR